MEVISKKQQDICNSAIEHLFDAEARIITQLRDKFASGWSEFEDALEVMRACKGRIIFTGMGKSGHVAKKTTATMSSLGKPAHFIHPAEASHGDMGMLIPGDVLVALSNSGNTSEIMPVLHYAKSINVPIIGVTMGAQSTLGQMSTIPLIIPKNKEGCYLGLAPTTSTSAQIALGDALAVGLAVLNDFTRDNFNQLHPGGSLGTSTSKVSQLMITGESMPLVEEGAPIPSILLGMAQKGFTVAGVVNAKGVLVGIIRASDISGAQGLKTAQIMRMVEPVLLPDDTMATAVSRMTKSASDCCFVVDLDNKPVGIVRKPS